jgi:hypothetical protein
MQAFTKLVDRLGDPPDPAPDAPATLPAPGAGAAGAGEPETGVPTLAELGFTAAPTAPFKVRARAPGLFGCPAPTTNVPPTRLPRHQASSPHRTHAPARPAPPDLPPPPPPRAARPRPSRASRRPSQTPSGCAASRSPPPTPAPLTSPRPRCSAPTSSLAASARGGCPWRWCGARDARRGCRTLVQPQLRAALGARRGRAAPAAVPRPPGARWRSLTPGPWPSPLLPLPSPQAVPPAPAARVPRRKGRPLQAARVAARPAAVARVLLHGGGGRRGQGGGGEGTKEGNGPRHAAPKRALRPNPGALSPKPRAPPDLRRPPPNASMNRPQRSAPRRPNATGGRPHLTEPLPPLFTPPIPCCHPSPQVGSSTPNFNRMEGNPICKQIDWDTNPELLAAWKEGRTGYPWIDAIMSQVGGGGVGGLGAGGVGVGGAWVGAPSTPRTVGFPWLGLRIGPCSCLALALSDTCSHLLAPAAAPVGLDAPPRAPQRRVLPDARRPVPVLGGGPGGVRGAAARRGEGVGVGEWRGPCSHGPGSWGQPPP